jgi:DNA repair protein RadC
MAKQNVTPVVRKRYPSLPMFKITRHGRIKEPEESYTCPDTAARRFNKMARLDREEFWVVHLDAKNRMVGYEVISTGSLTAAIIHPREVFKGAIMNSSAAIICLHNHPSGDPTPSREDISITERLKEGAELLGIRMLDHIIIGSKNKYCSLTEQGLM